MNQIEALRLIAETEPILKRVAELSQSQRCDDEEQIEFLALTDRIKHILENLFENKHYQVFYYINGRLGPLIDGWFDKNDAYVRTVQKA